MAVLTPTGPQLGKRIYATLRAIPTWVLWVLVVLWSIPTFGLFVNSFRDRNSQRGGGWWTARLDDFTIDNYIDILTAGAQGGLWRALLNSLAIALPATVIPIAIAAFAAYAFAWIDFKGREWLFIATVSLLAIPAQMSLIPLLQLYSGGAHISIPIIEKTITLFPDLDLAGRAIAVWLTHTGFALPFAIFLLHNYISQLPKDVFESAFIDGANHFTIFFRIVLPLSVPVLAAFAIFQFLWTYNDYLIAVTMIGANGANLPATVRIASLSGEFGQAEHLLTAGAFLSAVLPIAVFFALQRYFVTGILAGSVKGNQAMTNPIRFGVIGAGMMGIEHIGNILALEGAELAAVADPHQPSVNASRDAAGRPDLPAFADYMDMLEADVVDAVVIATPNMTHVDVLLDVMRTDTHILIEKPLCTTVEDCKKVMEADTDRDGVTWMGMEYRYMPAIARLIEEVDAGSIGDLKMLSIREHRFPFLPKVDDWNRFSDNTGGTMIEKCCHYFDLMNRIIGSPPVRVYASGGQDVNHLDEVYEGRRCDILDNAYAIVDYGGGQRAMLDLCMFAEGGRNQEEVVAVGHLGKIEAHNPSAEVAIGMRDTSWFSPTIETVADDRIAYEGGHHGSSFIEVMHFAEAIRSGGVADVTLEDGMLAVAMGAAAHRSMDTGLPVMMEDVL